jgi:hypothetical protein
MRDAQTSDGHVMYALACVTGAVSLRVTKRGSARKTRCCQVMECINVLMIFDMCNVTLHDRRARKRESARRTQPPQDHVPTGMYALDGL